MAILSIKDLLCDIRLGEELEKISAIYTDEKGKTIELVFYKSVFSADDDELILYAKKAD